MTGQEIRCTQCHREIKILKHSMLCGCGIKLRTIKKEKQPA
jgi:Zn finger protein HypA/HybF involved in hydrogenase expression